MSATDPSQPDTNAGFTYSVDWGDGSPVETYPAMPGNAAGQLIAHTFQAIGRYPVRVTATDKDGGTTTVAVSMPVDVTLPPVLRDVVINGGAPQRSQIDSIAFRIDPAVVPAAEMSIDGFRLLRDDGTAVSLGRARLVYNAATGQGKVLLNGTKLADGDYQLQVPTIAGIILPLNFFKLAGDATGDRIVNNADVQFVTKYMGKTTRKADLNGTGTVDGKDLKIVKRAMGHRLSTRIKSPLVILPGRNVKFPIVDFGQVSVGQAVQPVDLVIENGGQKTVTLSRVGLAGHSKIFSVAAFGPLWDQPDQLVLGPGQQMVIRVYLKPTYTPPPPASVVFYFDDGTTLAKAVVPLKVSLV